PVVVGERFHRLVAAESRVVAPSEHARDRLVAGGPLQRQDLGRRRERRGSAARYGVALGRVALAPPLLLSHDATSKLTFASADHESCLWFVEPLSLTV